MNTTACAQVQCSHKLSLVCSIEPFETTLFGVNDFPMQLCNQIHFFVAAICSRFNDRNHVLTSENKRISSGNEGEGSFSGPTCHVRGQVMATGPRGQPIIVIVTEHVAILTGGKDVVTCR